MKKVLLIVCLLVFKTSLGHANIFDNIALAKKINNCELVTKNIVSSIIPFTIEQGVMVIEVEITNGNGVPKKEKFILDTGAPTLYTVTYAKHAAVQMEAIDLKTATPLAQEPEEDKSYLTSQPTIFKIGDMQLRQEHVLVTNIKLPIIDCIGAAGLIGSRLLSEFIVTFDFKQNTITLSNKDKFDYKTIGNYTHKFRLSPRIFQKVPQPFLTVNGDDFQGIWDTGFTGTMLLQYGRKSSDKIPGIAKDTGVATYETYGILADKDGTMKQKTMFYSWKNTTVKNIENETIPVKDALVSCNENRKTSALNIGLQFMRGYDKMILDWNKNLIYLFNLQNIPADPFVGNVRINYLPDDKKFVVAGIDIKSSFYQKGLRAGDEIRSINGKLLTEINIANYCDVADKMSGLNKNVQVVVMIKNGQEVTLSL